MDKKTAIVTGLILVVISSALAYALLNKPQPSTKEESANIAPVTPSEEQTAPTGSVNPGVYSAYSPQAVSAAKGDILLFFHAPWCPQCRELEKSIQAATLPDNLTILKVDYDTSQELRQRYGVTLQTTLVKVDAEGNKVKSYVAYDEPTFEAVRRELL